MEYERIHKVQIGIISPTKLRMKLMGHQNHRKPDGSNCNSSRTSPSKVYDAEFAKNSLLAVPNGDHNDEVTSNCRKDSSEKDSFESRGLRTLQLCGEDGSSSNAINPMKSEDENLDYDSNASSSSFEFHNGERPGHTQMTRSLSRPMSSKWNNAEKWILGRQNGQPGTHLKKNCPQNLGCRLPIPNKVAAESAKRVEFFQPKLHSVEKFSFTSSDPQICGRNMLIDPCSRSKDLEEVDDNDFHEPVSPSVDATGIQTVRPVSMRDMGTEMTPVTSVEPSRTATPIGASPFRSPNSSIPSTPRRRGPASLSMEETSNEELKLPTEEEARLETRREIVALGVQLGKTSIAAWASKNVQEKTNGGCAKTAEKDKLKRVEFEKRAISWEEVEKSKHMARFKREEIEIQAWESQQMAKLEAGMQNLEARVEQMRVRAQAKTMKKIESARQRSEKKRAAAEARRKREARRTVAQIEYIRRTGKIPTSHYFCCGQFS